MPSLSAVAALAVPFLLAGCAGGCRAAGDHEDRDGPRDVATVEARAERAGDTTPIVPTLKPIVVDPPCVKAGARYGTAVALGDVDGDGVLEMVVGADGEGAVYVHRRKGAGFRFAGAYQASGPGTCPLLDQPGGFGGALALGDLDGEAGDEIAVGAPLTGTAGSSAGLVHLIGHSSGPTQDLGALPVTSLAPPPQAEGFFGKTLAVGDFDGDGESDLAVGAPGATVAGKVAGVVVVYFGPVSATGERLVIVNPAPVDNGNFGHALAVGDWNGDRVDDLVVSAVGNSVGGAVLAGQVYVFSAPLDAREFLSLEDPVPVEGDAPRFGMHVALRGNSVAIGSPRKDWLGVKDAGLGVLFGAEPLESKLFPHPQPFPDAILGFRVVLADLVGDSRVDLAVASLPKVIGELDSEPLAPGEGRSSTAGPGGPAPPNRGFWVWDGSEPGPAQQLLAAPGSADHFCQGVAAGQLWPGGREELVLGDYSWDRPGKGRKDNVGRVVVYRLPD